jgi:tripeptide aminopeptidase
VIVRDRLLQRLLEFIVVNGPSREERAVADRIRSELAALGIEAREDDAAAAVGGNCGNMVAKLPATGGGGPTLLFNAHMDTVQPTAGVRPIVSGDLVKSDGTTILGADDRSGVAIALEVAHSLLEDGTAHGEIILAFTVCEEVGLLGAEHLARRGLSAGVGFVLDGGDDPGRIVSAAPYHVRLKAVVRGKAAHAGVHPEEGINAIVIASRAISGMTLGRVDAESTANIGKIRGGEATNIVPELVELEGEARSIQEPKVKQQVAHMVEQLETAARALGGSAEVQQEMNYRGYRLSEDDPPIRLAMKAMQRLGIKPILEPSCGGTDGNQFNAAGIPTATLCTGGGNAHGRDEYCNIPVMVRCAELAQAIVREAAALPQQSRV